MGIRFSSIENAIMGLVRAEIVRNTCICFHVEYCLNDLSTIAQENPSGAGWIFSFTLTRHHKVTGDVN